MKTNTLLEAMLQNMMIYFSLFGRFLVGTDLADFLRIGDVV
jgi:hypothetical protein